MAIIAMWAATVVYWVISLVQYTNTLSAALQDSWLKPTNLQHRLMQVCLSALEHAEEKPLNTQCNLEQLLMDRIEWLGGNGVLVNAQARSKCAGSASLTVNVRLMTQLKLGLTSLVSLPPVHHWGRNCLVACVGSLAPLSCCQACMPRVALWGHGYVCHHTSETCSGPSPHMLTSLSVSGALSTREACTVNFWTTIVNGDEVTSGLSSGSGPDMFAGDVAGLIAVVVSLCTNILATALIAYRTWYVPPSITKVSDLDTYASAQGAPPHRPVFSERILLPYASGTNAVSSRRVWRYILYPLGKCLINYQALYLTEFLPFRYSYSHTSCQHISVWKVDINLMLGFSM